MYVHATVRWKNPCVRKQPRVFANVQVSQGTYKYTIRLQTLYNVCKNPMTFLSTMGFLCKFPESSLDKLDSPLYGDNTMGLNTLQWMEYLYHLDIHRDHEPLPVTFPLSVGTGFGVAPGNSKPGPSRE